MIQSVFDIEFVLPFPSFCAPSFLFLHFLMWFMSFWSSSLPSIIFFLPQLLTHFLSSFLLLHFQSYTLLRPSSTHFLLFILQASMVTFAANNFYTNYLICCKHVSFVTIRSDVHQRFSTGVFMEHNIFTRTHTQHEDFTKTQGHSESSTNSISENVPHKITLWIDCCTD